MNRSLRAPFNVDAELIADHSASLPISSSSQSSLILNPVRSIQLALPQIFDIKENDLNVAKPVSTHRDLFFSQELDVSRLNLLHKHLWAAGLPQKPRSLHRQLEIGRQICITEQADMHMLWAHPMIYIKPLPDFLLCHQIWADHLCKEPGVHMSAIGFLLSYVWLIMCRSDFKVAVDQGLINNQITWEKWSSFVGTLITNQILTSMERNPRYYFGELRFNRIQWIYRFCTMARRNEKSMIRGYYYTHQSYTTFIYANLAWLLTFSIFVTIVLTAMQVGLGTDRLQSSQAFQNASYGFTVFSIVTPMVCVVMVLLATGILALKNLAFTRDKKGKPSLGDPIWNNIALSLYKH